MSKKILFFLFTISLLAGSAQGMAKPFTLVIDAGHGGHDAGALGAFSNEKSINLKVALAFGRYVERNCPDVKVIYTRKTDVFIPLHERANIANKNKADLFISIHTNALPKGRISRGMETYTLGMHRASDNLDVAMRENSVILVEQDYQQRYAGFDPRSSESYIMFELMQDKYMAQSIELARLVQQKACATANRQNKGVKQAGFLVLRETSMPSCLIELGFITTPDEERFLNDAVNIDALGRGIYEAFAGYKLKYDSASKGRKTNNAAPAAPAAPVKVKESQPAPAAPEKQEPAAEPADTASVPVFKVQIMASEKQLPEGHALFKGQENVACYEEGKMYKYTVGESENYSEIYQLRKDVLEKFPQAFIIAFKDGKRTDVNKAIQEYKANKNKNK